MTAKDDPAVTLTLEADVALVLYDFLYRSMQEQNGEGLREVVQHEGELWSLELLLGRLESTLGYQFREDYADLVAKARERLLERCGSYPW